MYGVTVQVTGCRNILYWPLLRGGSNSNRPCITWCLIFCCVLTLLPFLITILACKIHAPTVMHTHMHMAEWNVHAHSHTNMCTVTQTHVRDTHKHEICTHMGEKHSLTWKRDICIHKHTHTNMHACMHERFTQTYETERRTHQRDTHTAHMGETHTVAHAQQKVCAIAGFSSRLLSSDKKKNCVRFYEQTNCGLVVFHVRRDQIVLYIFVSAGTWFRT